MLKNQVWQISALLMVAALCGGGGSGYGLANLIVQLAAIAILAYNFEAVGRFFKSAPRPMVTLVILSLSLPLLQIVPLPTWAWSTLPGRQLVIEAYDFAGGQQWSAISVNQVRTFVAFLSLVPAFTIIAVGWSLSDRDLSRVIGIIIGLGVLNLLPGIAEALSADGQSLLYPANKMPNVMFGLFANRNSTGIFLDCCLLLLVALPTSKRSTFVTFTKLLIATLLIVGVILTQSRSSIALLILPACLVLAKAISTYSIKSSMNVKTASRALIAAGLAAIVVVGMIPMLGETGLGETRLSTIADRFEQGDGQRSLIWEDAQFAGQRYWPIGAGMGTFDEVFQVDESLEYISPRRAGRAHNDYIELAIEAGVFGLALVIAWALWITLSARHMFSAPLRWPAIAGISILLAMALQSILDFPLRNQTMLCLAAFAILLIAPARRLKPDDEIADAEQAL